MEQYVKYLRKSRFDRDYAELSIEETLKRHEAILDRLAKDRGYYIAKTYYEVVSGESIAARPEIQKMLEEVSAGIYAGVIVVDLERLARGNGADQAYISQVFQFSGTKIVTPTKIYDPSNEFDDYIIGWLNDIDINLHIRVDLDICIEKNTDFLRCPSLHAIGHMGIGIQCKGGTVMPKHTRNCFDICSTLDS